ncbi:ferredoxin-type protein NapF [Rhodobacter sp. CZR27]|uniref:ferredoxin-type protein NapF n=1 Tax=Rhodobacter sp. CZR27 TaxID=2033869 RepID=UPI000BBECE4A|nr:ferredoxin-type protein NapF [Rhodobacter sp. CZR27]
MPSPSSRRAILRGHFLESLHPRPPGAGLAADFARTCTGCGDCARTCPEGIILRDRDGLPVLDMASGACTFCGACTRACTAGALEPGAPFPWRVAAGPDCLEATGTQCRACEDFCDASAIRFRPQTGGRALPVIDADICTGCGACIAPCPAGALALVPLIPETRPC